MSVEVLITYKDLSREALFHPFAIARVAREYWAPLAKKLNLETLQRLGALFIEDRAIAVQLVDELQTVRRHLEGEGQSDVPSERRDYMIRRIDELLPLFERALSEWDRVLEICI